MAMKSAVTATETLISTVSGLMEESRQLKEVIESQKQNKDYVPEIKHKMPLSRSNNQLQVPKMMKMNNDTAKDTKLLQATSKQQPKLGISKSQDDEDLKEQQYGSVSPISFTKTTTTTSRTAISSLGASRASNFRMKFRKSHTCGSLFAKCNCGTNTTSTEMETTHLAGSRAASIDNTTTALAAATTITQATIHNQSLYYQQQQQQQQQNLHLSMSPSSNTELSLASSVSDSAAKLTASSGFHSLSTQTSSATSAYLSREESLTASFDTQLISPTTETPPTTATTTIETTTATSTTTATKVLAIAANTEQLAKSNVSQETELVTLTRSKAQQIPRISSPPQLEAYNAKTLVKPTPVPSPRRSEVLHKSSAKKLFQSYSHPDTDFIFTDENKHPSRESLSLLQTPLLQNQDTVITTRGGKVEIKQPKRSSSPNIGQYQVLDVAVHPDILVKISPKHSPQCEIRRTPLATRSTAQRRRLLQRSHEIDSGGSTTDSEKSLDLRTHGETQFFLGKPNSSSPLLTTKLLPGQSSPASLSEDANFDAAQKYFAESGILGPIHGQSNLIRKTSKALHDSNVIEQVSKNLRSQTLNTGNSNQATNASSMRKNSTTSPGSSALTSPTKSGFTTFNTTNNSLSLKIHDMTTTSPTSPGAAGTAQPALIYSPPSPQSPHTMATKCGFSPNVTTQSCIVVDDKDAQIKSLQGEIVSLKDVIKSRDAEIVKLRREIHKLKVTNTSSLRFFSNGTDFKKFTLFSMRCMPVLIIICWKIRLSNTHTLASDSTLMEAVLVQLYNIANSPKAFPGPMIPNILPFFSTSNSPSAETYKCAPTSPSLITNLPFSMLREYIESTNSLTCEASIFFKKSLSIMASFINCIQDIKKHKWFLGFDWDGLQSQLLIPPFVRPIAHPTDTCYFDRFPCDPNEPPDELSGWDAGF
ncbi:A-agglutinin anchorage subunit [Lucilia cuprina]|uniref:A-agglutinin anchorage subunit n=1 Tax=Lucilia cuprina TaxID=7375 RepID=UPI001F070211|nr:A-agglutinin anchorage subunit [Lucilia cuprina]